MAGVTGAVGVAFWPIGAGYMGKVCSGGHYAGTGIHSRQMAGTAFAGVAVAPDRCDNGWSATAVGVAVSCAGSAVECCTGGQ